MAENSFDKIKKLMKIIGGKVIIVEDGKPTMVVIDVDEYIGFEKKEHPEEEGKTLSDKRLVEKINKSVNVWKDKQEKRKIKQFREGDYKEAKQEVKNKIENKKSDDEIVDEIVIEKL